MTKTQISLKLATDYKRVKDMMDIDAHRTRQGHWHPWSNIFHTPCTNKCPAGDPRTRTVHLNMLRSV